MKRSVLSGVGLLATASMLLTACGGDGGSGGSGDSADGPVSITMAGWSLSTTPEFQLMADAFNDQNPDVTVELKEYDATEYDTQMIADLSAGSAPDVYILKNLLNFYTYQDGGQLLDVSDVADDLADDVHGADSYEVDGKTFAIPYRQDSWYVYYNRDLFDAAGVDYPEQCWTWDDYAEKAEDLTTELAKSKKPAKGTYQHVWQSVIQGFANSQSEADILDADYDYMVPYYERALELQDSGAAASYGTATTNSLTYQAEFGTQKAAMLPMGSWYVATLIAEQKSGSADTFNWGIAPAPQQSCPMDTPVTFGDPTGLGINPAIDEEKVEAAKEFLAFVASEEGASALAEIGITPAYASDAVTEAYFGLEGVPTDELSQFAFGTHDTKPENPVSASTAGVQSVLSDAHSELMSESSDVSSALSSAADRAADELE